MKSIIFDLDGTLCDTISDISAALDRALEKKGYPPINPEYAKTLVGGGSRDLVRKAVNLPTERSEVDDILKQYNEEYLSAMVVDTKPYDGIPDALHQLSSDGYRLAVVSNKPDVLSKGIVGQLMPEIDFVTVIGKREGVPLKPDPSSVLEVMSMIGSDAASTVYVGDSAVDLRTAKNAGIKCISVLWGYQGRGAFDPADEPFFIEKPSELVSAVKKLIG